MNARIRFLLMATFIIGVASWALRQSQEADDTNRPEREVRLSQLAPPTRAEAPSRAPAGKRAATVASDSWLEFKERYGSSLEADFTPDGKLAQIKGGSRSGNPARPGFSTADAELVLARAEEIVAAASKLLRIRPEHPLGAPKAQTGPASAQVFFTESQSGQPVLPQGQITVDLGPEGELLGLYSDYVDELAVSNTERLDDEAASQYAGAPAGTGRKVVWVSGNDGKQAYEYNVKGRQIVIDAENGNVLISRDRRTF